MVEILFLDFLLIGRFPLVLWVFREGLQEGAAGEVGKSLGLEPGGAGRRSEGGNRRRGGDQGVAWGWCLGK